MLAMTLRPSPAASMNVPSIFSVTVERTPSAPLAASRGSARSGGASARALAAAGAPGRGGGRGLRGVGALGGRLGEDGYVEPFERSDPGSRDLPCNQHLL